MRSILALLALVSTIGCVSPAAVRAENEEMARDEINRMVFVKDAKTGLCFGYVAYAYSSTIVYVPCDKVGL